MGELESRGTYRQRFGSLLQIAADFRAPLEGDGVCRRFPSSEGIHWYLEEDSAADFLNLMVNCCPSLCIPGGGGFVEINALLPAIEVRSGPHHIASHHHNGAGASRARFEASHRLLPSSTITGARQVWSNSAAGCFCQHHHEYRTFDSTSSLPCPCPALPASHPACSHRPTKQRTLPAQH
jgi:hypothetical protein